MTGEGTRVTFLTFLYLGALAACLSWSWFATGPEERNLEVQAECPLDLKRQRSTQGKCTDQVSGPVPVGQDLVNRWRAYPSRQGTFAPCCVPVNHHVSPCF